MKKTPISHPAKAVLWSISGADNKVRLTAINEDGLGVNEWPIDDCTVETIRERWGAGTYKCQWYGKKEGRRTPMGQSATFEIHQEPQVVEKAQPVAPQAMPQAVMPVYPPSPQQAFLESLQVSSMMQQNAMQTFGGVFEMVGRMMAGLSRPQAVDPNAGMMNQQILSLLQQQQAAIAKLEARLDEEYEDDDGDEDGEDLEVVKDGSLNTDAILNKGLSKIPDLIQAGSEFMSSMAAEKRGRAQSPASGVPVPLPTGDGTGQVTTT